MRMNIFCVAYLKIVALCEQIRKYGAKHPVWFLIFILLFTILRIGVGADRGIKVLYVPHDDLLFLKQAHNIANGMWLGDWSSLIIAKECFFSCFIALAILLGIPYVLSLDLLLCGVSWLLVLAVAPRMKRLGQLLLYLLLIFNPGYFAAQRVLIQDFYVILLSGFIFCLLGCWIRRDSDNAKLLPWLLGGSLFYTFLVHTRTEGKVFLLIYIAMMVMLLWYAFRKGRQRRKIIGLACMGALMPAIIFGGTNLTIRAINYHKYGIAETSLRNNSAYRRFIGSVLGAAKQLDPRWDIRIPLRYEVFDQLCAVSPSLSRLKPYLGRWHINSVDRFPAKVLRDNPDLISNTKGGFVQWQLLEAMEGAGYFRGHTWEKAEEFFRKTVEELQTAGQEGHIPGFKVRCSNLPPCSKQMFQWFVIKFCWDAKHLWSWKKFYYFPEIHLKTSKRPEAVYYYDGTKDLRYPSDLYVIVRGWGVRDGQLLGPHNFDPSSVLYFERVHRPDVQKALTASGLKNIPAECGFMLMMKGRRLRVRDNQGKCIYDVDVRKKKVGKGIYIDRVEYLPQRNIVVMKRKFMRSLCVFTKKNGGYISFISLLLVLCSVIRGVVRRNCLRDMLDINFSGWVLWGAGFISFCLIIFANTMLHCPRHPQYYLPAASLIYSACCVFIIGNLTLLFSKCSEQKL